jgi:hypothetical protein
MRPVAGPIPKRGSLSLGAEPRLEYAGGADYRQPGPDERHTLSRRLVGGIAARLDQCRSPIEHELADRASRRARHALSLRYSQQTQPDEF